MACNSRVSKVLFVATGRGHKTLYALQQTPNIKIHFVEVTGQDSRLARIRKFSRILRHLTRKEPPQAILWDAFGGQPYLLSQVARLRGTYNLMRLRGDVWTEIRGKLRNASTLRARGKYRSLLWFATRMVKECDLLLPVSQALGDRAIAETGIGGAKCKPLSTYIDAAWFEPNGITEQIAAKQQNGVDGKSLILTITNFNYWDKVEPLLHFAPVYAQLIAAHPNLLWVIGGRGEYLARFQSKLKDTLGADAPALLPGWLEARPSIRSCDLFLYFSNLDGLSNVIMEAGAAGKVVIANRYPAFQEIIQDQKTGYIVDPEEHATVYTLVDRLLTTPALRYKIGTAAQEHIRVTFSAEAVSTRFHTLLAELIGC